MELPIFNDNLKSSGSWTALLAREQEAWKRMPRELTGPRVREHQVKHILTRIGAQPGERVGPGIDERRVLDAARMVSSWASDPEAKFNLERLLELHRALIGASVDQDLLRKAAVLPINPGHDPAPALIVPRMLDNAFEWFDTDSFDELHPVERASVVYLRLLDLHPFATATETTALLAASFFTENAGFPPLILFSDETTVKRYSNVLEAAFRMLTQPLVEFFAEMLRRTMLIAREDKE